MSVVFSLLAFLVAITLLVAVHEYGHYLVARLSGIKVLRFSIGFGKPLFSRRAGADQTEYCISALPLGGYVKMLDEREGDVAPADAHRSFNAQPIWQRIAVLLAGPAFNFLFVIVAFWVLFLYGVPTQKAVVGVVEADSLAAHADLRSGDTIVAVAGNAVNGWEPAFLSILEDMVDDGRIDLRVAASDGAERPVTIEVGDDSARLTEPGALLTGLGFSPWSLPALVGELAPESPAGAAGMLPGDEIISIDAEPVRNFRDMVGILAKYDAAVPVVVEYVRHEAVREANVTLMAKSNDGVVRYVLGIIADSSLRDEMVEIVRFGPLAAIPAAVGRLTETTGYTLRMLGRMLTGDVSLKNLSGPVSIAQFAGQAAQAGLDYYIWFLAVISISLGILNLLPIPLLDGGQIVYQIFEWITGSPLSDRAQMVGQQFGILVLLGVMGFAFYNDLARLFAGS